ncbi:MAG: nuclear transport factor 2 family protein [Cyclobacteriaceae bacterium]
MITNDTVMLHEKMLLEVVKASDVETLDQLVHDDLLFHVPCGDVITKKMDLDSHRAGNMVVEDITATNYVVTIIGDVSVVSLVLEAKGSIKMETKGKIFNQRMDGSSVTCGYGKSMAIGCG